MEAKLNETAAQSKLLEPPEAPDTVQVYDFVAQRAFVGATKELMVDSLADEVGYVSVTRACPRRASAGGSRRHVGTSLS